MPLRLEMAVAESAGNTRVAQPITGWPLPFLARLDRGGARGLLADLMTAGPLTRQAAFLVSACPDLDETAFLGRLGIAASSAVGIGLALRTRSAREVIAAAYAVAPEAVPTGYLRALARIEEINAQTGLDPFAQPESYSTLFHIFTAKRHCRKANALRYCGPIRSGTVEAAESLDPLLVWPETVRMLGTARQVGAANALLSFLREVITSATDAELVLAMRRSLASRTILETFAQKVLERADRLAPPPFPHSTGLRPLTSADDLRDLGRRMSNCAGTKIAECALGLLSIYEVTHRDADGSEHRLAVTLTPTMDGSWLVADIKGHKNSQPPAAAQRAVLKRFRALGALIPGPPLHGRYRHDLARALGAYRWGALDDVLRGADGAAPDALAELETTLGEVA